MGKSPRTGPQGANGGTIGMFRFSEQSKQSEDFLNQGRRSVR